jgi:hypothetical protein
MTSRCHDTFRGDRCELRAGHEGPHRRGSHIWDFRDIPRPAWLGNMRAKELVR